MATNRLFENIGHDQEPSFESVMNSVLYGGSHVVRYAQDTLRVRLFGHITAFIFLKDQLEKRGVQVQEISKKGSLPAYDGHIVDVELTGDLWRGCTVIKEWVEDESIDKAVELTTLEKLRQGKLVHPKYCDPSS